MKIDNSPSTILLVLGILLLLKAVFGAAVPETMKRVAERWTRAARQVNTLLAIVCLALAVALLIVVLMHQPLTNWMLAVLALLYAWTASVVYRPDTYERVVRRTLLDRKPMTVRVIFICLGLVAIGLIVIAIGQY